MISDNTFKYALIISMVVHAAIFLNPSVLKLPQKPKDQKIEINYIKMATTQYAKLEEEKKEINLKTTQRIQIKKIQPPPFINKDEIFKNRMMGSLPKPSIPKPDIILVKKIVQLKPIELEKINNPVYTNYYQTVREKIRRSAYQNYNRSDTGQVYLTFIIIADGTLGSCRIIEEKTNANSYLKGVALKSIKDASPFPVFPKELSYPQLTFNVIISFEIE
ncbi:MAG: energy transducer TonB [Candidatus Omnitrophica bacterium]|nr:energy transducer TonB [Candidatus Omnitrophota bacterium]